MIEPSGSLVQQCTETTIVPIDDVVSSYPLRPVKDEVLRLYKIFGGNPFGSSMKNTAEENGSIECVTWLNGDGNIMERKTYSDVWQDVAKLAVYMKDEMDVKLGDQVVLCFPPRIDFIIAFYACIVSGVCAVAVYPPDPSKARTDVPRFCDIHDIAESNICLTNTSYSRVAQLVSTIVRDPRWSKVNWVPIERATKMISKSRADSYILPDVPPSQLAFLQFTSGSTSQPKGVMVTHGSLLHNAHACASSFGFPGHIDDPTSTLTTVGIPYEKIKDVLTQRRDLSIEKYGHSIRAFSWLPVYHDMGLIGFVVTPLLFGGAVIQMSPIDFIKKPHIWLQAMCQYDCGCCAAPNFAYDLVCRKMPDDVYEKLDFRRVCGFLCGAEPIRPSTVERFIEKFGPKGFKRNFFQPAFGLAETTLIVSCS